ncbi:hypothetical protein ACJX0J_004518 (mitochondrion) [Zea mays]
MRSKNNDFMDQPSIEIEMAILRWYTHFYFYKAYPDRDSTSGEANTWDGPTIVQNIFFLKASTGYNESLVSLMYRCLGKGKDLLEILPLRDAYSNHEHEVQNRQQ